MLSDRLLSARMLSKSEASRASLWYFHSQSVFRQVESFNPNSAMHPTVSILIPAYNAERWVGSALASALNQSWPHIEIILVDDGSRDQTVEVAKRFESGKVKIVRQENRGAAAARNTALREAQGELIQYLDADDLISTDKIKAQVDLLQSNAPGYVAVSPAVYFKDGEDPDSGLPERSGLVDSDDPVQWLTEFIGPDGGRFGTVPCGAWLTPRSVTEQIGPWDDTVRSPDDDGEYFTRIVLGSRGVRHSTSGRYYYRKFSQGGTYSSTFVEELVTGRLYSLNCKAKWLLARTNDLRTRRAFANRYKDLAFTCYPFFPQLSAEALRRAQELGGTTYVPRFGTWKGELLRHLVGWKTAKWLNAVFYRYAHQKTVRG